MEVFLKSRLFLHFVEKTGVLFNIVAKNMFLPNLLELDRNKDHEFCNVWAE